MDGFSIGQTLREAREAKELLLEDAEATLKIRRHILEGFEQGNFNVLDASPVQIRGFIRNYARYLALDEERILSFYDAMLNGGTQRERRRSQRLAEREKRATGTYSMVSQRPVTEPLRQPLPERSSRSGKRGSGPSRILALVRAVLMLAIGVAAISVIAYVTMQLLQQPTAANENGSGASPGVAMGQLPPTLTSTSRPSATPLITPTFAPLSAQNYAGEPVFTTIELRQRTWLRVTVDGVEQFAGMLRPQEAILEYRALTEIVVNASNAAALVITYNGQVQPGFGARGQGVDIVFRPNNAITVSGGAGFEPTPIFSATPEDTAIPFASTLLAEQTLLPTLADSALPTEGVATEDSTQMAPPVVTPLPAFITETPPPAMSPVVPTQDNTSLPVVEPTATAPGANGELPPRITPTNSTPTKEGT